MGKDREAVVNASMEELQTMKDGFINKKPGELSDEEILLLDELLDELDARQTRIEKGDK